jgi:hypothetical protein
MEKEFIPYEQALALKELGFEEPCFGAWVNNELFITKNEKPKIQSLSINQCTAPLYQQASKFFREKCNHYAFLQPTSDLISENYCFKILDQYSGKFYSKSYETYKEAELECLKKLIEIVKIVKNK